VPELRFDQLRGEWVVIAAERAARPHQFRAVPGPSADAEVCPFCPGNEHETPPAIMTLPGADGGWSLRVVPNKFPALVRGSGAAGAHEVVIETERHAWSAADYSEAKMTTVLRVFRDRARHLLEEGFQHVLVFRNDGPMSGASLPHPHTQIAALPEAPAEARRLESSFRKHGECIVCTMVAEERERGERVIRDDGGWIVMAPYASRFPYQMRVLKADHSPSFEQSSDEDLQALASRVREALARLRDVAGDVSLNWLLHTGPAIPHWVFDLLPRRAHVGGFELGTGMFINSVPPESAASRLRGRE